MHLRTDPAPVLFHRWQAKEDEKWIIMAVQPALSPVLTGYSTRSSKLFLGSVHAFDNIFLQAISLYVNIFSFTVGVETWQLGEAEVPPTATVACGRSLPGCNHP